MLESTQIELFQCLISALPGVDLGQYSFELNADRTDFTDHKTALLWAVWNESRRIYGSNLKLVRVKAPPRHERIIVRHVDRGVFFATLYHSHSPYFDDNLEGLFWESDVGQRYPYSEIVSWMRLGEC